MTGCSTISNDYVALDQTDEPEMLIIYKDGKMEYKSRFVDQNDVVIYNDGRGGERAAVKVRVPIHPDFYRDSIVVVRVDNRMENTVSQNETNTADKLN